MDTVIRAAILPPMRTALAALALVVAAGMAAGVAQAQQKLPTVSELLKAEAKATEACEGGGDAAIVSEQCRLWDWISRRLA
jgi:invasion protein IalB